MVAKEPLARENIPEMHIVRAICILAVLTVHATSFAVIAMKDHASFGLYNFIQYFAQFGTPAFVFLSSFVTFYNYYPRRINRKMLREFYLKRCKYILIPYLFFSIVYYVVVYVMRGRDWGLAETLQHFFSQLLIGKTYTHLYFVFIIFQFYLLFPLLLWLVQRYAAVLRYGVPVGIVLQYSFFLLNEQYFHISNQKSWLISYASFIMLAALLGSHYPSLKQWIIVSRDTLSAKKLALWVSWWAIWAAGLAVYVYVYYYARMNDIDPPKIYKEIPWHIHTLLICVILIQVAYGLQKVLPNWLKARLTDISVLSFGIYLVHPLFNIVYRSYPVQSGNLLYHHLWYAGGFWFALLASWLTVSLFNRYVPFSWAIFGNVTDRRQKAIKSK